MAAPHLQRDRRDDMRVYPEVEVVWSPLLLSVAETFSEPAVPTVPMNISYSGFCGPTRGVRFVETGDRRCLEYAIEIIEGRMSETHDPVE